ncbi:gamma-glutamyltransferase [Variovorax sp. EBFNA2]|uniref:gamma-glutamyltransferase n=1 Tax=Variovorax sp. EBFNA2 TaxID=3342097 RepID=UPI0029BFF641|nr:gamma-glutamyltransferase [Variovorax boronicumulans]WPG41129.1 gamma-glutamyltransferase [Variovorax boronicumulans]
MFNQVSGAGRAMMVAAQPEAAEVGALALMRGGNAIDAAVSAAFAQCVVDPLMAGIAGYGTMVVHRPAADATTCIEFYARAPAAVTPDIWANKLVAQTQDGYAFVVEGNVNEVGHQAVGTLGTLAGLVHALERYGTVSLAQALAPAIALAEEGFAMRPHMYHYCAMERARDGMKETQERLQLSATGRAAFFDAHGNLKRPGDRIVNPDLGRTLRRIAQEGTDVFYRGEIASRIVQDMQAHGGFLSMADLTGYEVSEAPPIRGRYRGFDVAALPPPGGGISLIQTLQVLSHFDLKAMGHNSPAYLHTLAEALKWTTIDKDAFVGDPRFVQVPLDKLLSAEHAQGIADRIRSGARASVRRGTEPSPPEPKDTTQLCVVDAQGNAVSLTHTLGTCSGVITDGLGFMYNGLMSGFDPRPGHAASLGPGRSRTSSQCPVILFRDGRPAFVLGAPGGTAICSALVQTIVNMVDFGMSPTEAVSAPRISATSDTIEVSNRIPRYITDELARQGHPVSRTHLGFAFAAPHVISIEPDLRLRGGADPQRDGVALEVAVQEVRS